ncbi:MAG: VanZ family protein [Planctomycetota bacterium]|nr:VanZ family protein [Planctomycetota bacterium]
MTQQTAWRALAWLSTLGVLVMCFLPGDDVPSAGLAGLDKVLHFAAFFVVAYAWRRSGLSTTRVLAIGLLLASATELGQHWLVPGRQGDWIDWLSDAGGVVASLALAHKRQQGAQGPAQAS